MLLALGLLAAVERPTLAQESSGTDVPQAAETPVEVDPFNLIISRWDDTTVMAYSAFGSVSKKYGALDREGGEALLFTIGSIHQSVVGTSHPDWLVAIDGMIGRGFILLRDYDNARRWLESALARGESGGLTDANLSGILRDLAWLASARGDEAAASDHALRADVCPMPCGAEISWLVSREADKFSAEAREILGSSEFWRRRAEDRRRDAEIFVGGEFGEDSLMVARLLQTEAGAIPRTDPAALTLIERAIPLLRENDADASMILSALLLRMHLVEASGDTSRAIDLAGELVVEAAVLPEAESLRVAVTAAEKRVHLLREADLPEVAAAYADAVTLAVWAGGVGSIRENLLRLGIEAGYDRDARRLAEALLLVDPADEDVLALRLSLAERLGEQAEIERLNAIVNPLPGRRPSEREIALSRLQKDAHRFVVPAETFAGAPATDWPEDREGVVAKLSLRSAASVHAALSRLDARDDVLLAEGVTARIYLMGRQYDEAERRYSAMLAEAELRGWSEARLSSIVADLAFLAERSGDGVAATAWRERAAAACAAPCNEALFREIWIESRLAGMLADKVMSPAEERRERDRYFEDAIAYLDENLGETAPETVDAWESWAEMARQLDDRPWQTIDLHRRVIEKRLAEGRAPTDLLSIRRTLLQELLKAGEYRRLIAYADPLIADARAVGSTGILVEALRHKARALWHLGEPDARAAYGEVIAVLRAPETAEKADGTLLLHLVDARYEDEILEVADLLLEDSPGSEWLLIAKARVAADRGDPTVAADILAGIENPGRVALLQRAHFLELAGDTGGAEEVRRETTPPELDAEVTGMAGVFERFNRATNPFTEIDALIHPRDFGAYEGAAAAALDFLPSAEEWIRAGHYVHAQMLWQLAFTLARGGETANAFRLMKAAASIAVGHSFADANATDGGSLQLLRRDKFRYLLFIDIAWAHVSGRSPAGMSMSSRY